MRGFEREPQHRLAGRTQPVCGQRRNDELMTQINSAPRFANAEPPPKRSSSYFYAHPDGGKWYDGHAQSNRSTSSGQYAHGGASWNTNSGTQSEWRYSNANRQPPPPFYSDPRSPPKPAAPPRSEAPPKPEAPANCNQWLRIDGMVCIQASVNVCTALNKLIPPPLVRARPEHSLACVVANGIRKKIFCRGISPALNATTIYTSP